MRIEELSVTDTVGVDALIADANPDVVVHLAAVVNPVALARDPRLAMTVNLGGTVNVLEATRKLEAARLIYVSSIGVLPSVVYEPIDAHHPVITATEGPGAGFYGASKLASEAFCFAYESGFGLDFRIIRPSAVYGFGMQWPLYIKPLVEGAVRGEPVRLPTGGTFPRDYTHAEDVASLIVAAAFGPSDGDRVFYAATGERLVTPAEIARIVREIIPGADIEIGNELSQDDQIELRYRGLLSIENATDQLNWAPKYGLIRDGIAQYIDVYRQFLKTK